MKYNLSAIPETSTIKAMKKFAPFLAEEKRMIIFAFFAMLVNTGVTLIAPLIVGNTINTSISHKDYNGILQSALLLLLLYVTASITSYFQTKIMGSVGQRLLFNLRHKVFMKLQELPIAFFNQNKAGDLISRINNDTDRLNDFLSRALVQFASSVFMMAGTAVFIVYINPRLGALALAPALLILIFTRIVSGWVKKKNAVNLKETGNMSAEISESLDNFKVVVAFNRRDYFQTRFEKVNNTNYQSAVSAGIANNIFTPVYGLATNIAQILVLFYGIYLISMGEFSIGYLISYFVYLSRFYDPIRQIAGIWSTFQTALAGWDRISAVLNMHSDLQIGTSVDVDSNALMELKNVAFGYGEKEILSNINMKLEKGKTYALVGPTGGGKTTTASLMARLYDPTEGNIYLDGKNIKSYPPEERVKKIGFILQEPFLFSGSLKENIIYGNSQLKHVTSKDLVKKLAERGLSEIMDRFDHGLDTHISSMGETVSLGQRQIIAFVRAVLRSPEILILDEATANIDTLTEQLLGKILEKLPTTTTKVVIAHRLNTIENADEIFFVNAGKITTAGSFQHAMEMLLKDKRES